MIVSDCKVTAFHVRDYQIILLSESLLERMRKANSVEIRVKYAETADLNSLRSLILKIEQQKINRLKCAMIDRAVLRSPEMKDIFVDQTARMWNGRPWFA